jgi:hypothetical protein
MRSCSQRGIKFVDFGFDFEPDYSHSDVPDWFYFVEYLYKSHSRTSDSKAMAVFVFGLSSVNVTAGGLYVNILQQFLFALSQLYTEKYAIGKTDALWETRG